MGALQGRTAIITGGGRGIGLHTAQLLAEQGCSVVLAARGETEIRAAAEAIHQTGGRALPVCCDVAVEREVRSLVDATAEQFGGINIVINNAGGVCRELLVDTSVEQWDHVLQSQVRGTFLVTRLALPHLLAAGWGRVLTVSSMAGKIGVARRVAYCTAKWGQIGFTEALDEELQGTGVRAHVVCPGPVATRMRAEGYPNEDPESLIQPETVARQIVSLITLPETAYIREVCIRTGLPTRYKDIS